MKEQLPQLVTAVPRQRVALRGTRLTVVLAGGAQKATFEQTFVNLEAVAIEAVYTFPLPAAAAVCGFEVVTGDRVLTGQVEEAEAALARYDAAVSAGDGAFLLEQQRPDVFTVNVGNLKPGQAATVKISFVAPLTIRERRLRLAYPTTLAPRYVTASGQADPVQAEMDGEALNPPHVLCVPYGLTLALDVRLGRALRGITSPTHAIRTETPAQDMAAVALSTGTTAMDRDLVIEIEFQAEAEPVAQAGKGPDGRDAFVAVTFLPEFEPAALTPAAPQDVTFVLDCSGSMQGQSIAQAKRALELCLRSLSLGDRFSICRFGGTFGFMEPTGREYSEDSLRQALEYVSRIEADLGGTELFGALEAVLSQPPRGDGLRSVILLTDGQVTNEEAVIRLAEARRATHRIFSFGIGSACSHHLVQGLADSTQGAAEFVSGAERIEEKVLRTFSRIGSPRVTDLRLDWGTSRAQQAPAALPPLFDGDPLTAYACVDGEVPASVTLSCRLDGTPREWRLPVTGVADGGAIALTWARARLRDLEASLPVDTPFARRTAAPQQHRDLQQVVELSKGFGVLSSRTSFVAVEHRSLAERNEGRPELRRVPVQLAHGWHGIEVAAGFLAAVDLADSGTAYLACTMPPPASASRRLRQRAVASGLRVLGRSAAPAAFRLCEGPAALTPPAVQVPTGPTPLGPHQADATEAILGLLAAQTAAGWFEWRREFEALLGAVPGGGGKLRAQIAAAFGLDGRPDCQELLCTLLVLWVLQHRFPASIELARRGVRKALAAVGGALGIEARAVQRQLEVLAPAGQG
jgi:Ca-activated chloride channel family protein